MFDEQPLAELVEVDQRFAPQITRGPDDEVLEFKAAEPIPQRGVEHAEKLAHPDLPAPDSIADVNRGREAIDQRTVEIEECTDPRSWWAGGDLGNGIGGGEHRHRHRVDSVRYRAAVMYCECMKLSIFTSTSGGVMP
jgi:hypothetical protein